MEKGKYYFSIRVLYRKIKFLKLLWRGGIFMLQMKGKQSVLFQEPVKIMSHACVGRKKRRGRTHRETFRFNCR